jgi:phosphatidylinositol-3-phosphatase
VKPASVHERRWEFVLVPHRRPRSPHHTNLVDQLESNGLTWGAYMESMPSAGYLADFWPSSSQQLYASKHNPFVLFNDIRSNPARRQAHAALPAASKRRTSPHSPSTC